MLGTRGGTETVRGPQAVHQEIADRSETRISLLSLTPKDPSRGFGAHLLKTTSFCVITGSLPLATTV